MPSGETIASPYSPDLALPMNASSSTCQISIDEHSSILFTEMHLADMKACLSALDDNEGEPTATAGRG